MTVTALVPLVIAVVGMLVAPLLLARQINKARQEEKLQDWARQDAVAAAAQASAERVQAVLVETDSKVNGKLDVIHSLVNSEMTRAIKGQLVALQAQLIMMQDKSNGVPSKVMLEAMTTIRAQITELQTTLDERAKGQAVADERSR